MGGLINVALRFKDGRTVLQQRWTNPLPLWFKTCEFLNGDESYLEKYIAAPEEQVKCSLAPDGYGLIVADFKTNHFLEMQSYSRLGHIAVANIFIRLNDSEYIHDISNLIKEKRLTYDYRGQSLEIKEIHDQIVTKNIDELITQFKEFQQFDQHMNVTLQLKIKTDPLTLIEFEEDDDGARQFREKLLEFDFEIDDEANKMWDEYIT